MFTVTMKSACPIYCIIKQSFYSLHYNVTHIIYTKQSCKSEIALWNKRDLSMLLQLDVKLILRDIILKLKSW